MTRTTGSDWPLNAMHEPTLTNLLWRYLTFVWLVDVVPVRASELQKAAIIRGNRDRGLRFLPVYLRRYLHFFLLLVLIGSASEALAGPLLSGACFTLSVLVLIAWTVAGIGFTGMRLRAFDHGRY